MNKALQDFLERVSSDAVLQAAFSEAVARGSLDAIVRLGAEAGASFTVADLEQAWKDQSAELTDEDLSKVAGGGMGMVGGPAYELELQQMMDRRSKFISTLSNIMKGIASTQDTMVDNLK